MRALVFAFAVATTVAFPPRCASAFTDARSISLLEIPLPGPDRLVRPVIDVSRSPLHDSSLAPGWKVELRSDGRSVTMAYGGGERAYAPPRDARSAEAVAREFLRRHEDVIALGRARLGTPRSRHARGKWAVRFPVEIDGIPVWGASAFVLMDDAGRIAAFGAPGVPERVESRGAAISATDAFRIAASSLGSTEAVPSFPAEPVWVVVDGAARLAHRIGARTGEPFGSWDTLVDASSGEILSRTSRIHPLDVTGTVTATLEDHGYCDGEEDRPLPLTTVSILGGASGVTDASGQLTIPYSGPSTFAALTNLTGPYLATIRAAGLGSALAILPGAEGVPLVHHWDDTNSRADERDLFLTANRAHDFMKAIDPSFAEIDYGMPCIVGRSDGFCPGNAWWDSDSLSINFCAAGSGFANTGRIGNVAYHEYGHGVSQLLYEAQGSSLANGALHEGNSDVLANFIDRNPIIGLGFSQDVCGSGIRNADNTLIFPDDVFGGSGHHDGQILAGFYWDLWQALLGVLPQAEADAVAWRVWHESRALGVPLSMPDQVLWTFLADDDDADLTNGTPHDYALCVAATNHGFACPEVTTGVFFDHTPLPHTMAGPESIDVIASIHASGSALDPDSPTLHWRRRGGLFQSVAMTPTGSTGEFSAPIPIPAGTWAELEYYLGASDEDGRARLDPPGAPGLFYAFDVGAYANDFEGADDGWSPVDPFEDDAEEGLWTLADPVGTSAQPEDDATPGSGTRAWFTGQCGDGFDSCINVCTEGCSDVDGGRTTLVSRRFDLSGVFAARFKYERWYSDTSGPNPGDDTWRVDISNDDGVTWTNAILDPSTRTRWTTEQIDVKRFFARPDRVRLRFVAEDTGVDSEVEAAVDDVRLLTRSLVRTIELAGNDASAALPEFSLRPVGLVRAGDAIPIAFSFPQRGGVALAVFDVRGRAVRRLQDGALEAGRYEVAWDGRDSTGRPVASGVYFARLVSGGRARTEKIVLVR